MEEFDVEAYTKMVRTYQKNDDPTGWFDSIYKDAKGDYKKVFWADLEPSFYLVNWVKENPIKKQFDNTLADTIPIKEAPKQTNGKFLVKYGDNKSEQTKTNIPTKTPTKEDALTGPWFKSTCKKKVTIAETPPTKNNIYCSIPIEK